MQTYDSAPPRIGKVRAEQAPKARKPRKPAGIVKKARAKGRGK